MNREELYESMSGIDDDLLERSERAATSGKKAWKILLPLAACLCIVLAAAVIGREHFSPEPPTTAPGISGNDDRILLDLDETAAAASYIVDAVYIGSNTTDYITEFLFRPKTVWKGSMETAEDTVIFVQVAHSAESLHISFETGKTYMLFLNKHTSVYYEYEVYSVYADWIIAEDDAQWENYHSRAEAAAGTPEPDSDGDNFTTEEDPEAVSAFASDIYVVRIDSVQIESPTTPTTVYNCTVLKTVKNTPAADGKIMITLFNDTVCVGGEYLVMLSHSSATSMIYTLASRSGVYSLEDAKTHPVLRALLEQAVYYSPASMDEGYELIG